MQIQTLAALKTAIEQQDVATLASIMQEQDLELVQGKIMPKTAAVKEKLKYWHGYWDQRQQARKINLNASYGALTNAGSKFSDQRIGQSTTLCGRVIAKHMHSKIAELLLGTYQHDSIVTIAGDTDSSFFCLESLVPAMAAEGMVMTRDLLVDISNTVAAAVNASFPDFITQAFHVQPENSGLIRCAREFCAERGIFIKKKKYAMLYFDKNNKRQDIMGSPGKMKIMGLDTQRADTPKRIQDFLREVLYRVLQGHDETSISAYLREFRNEVKQLEAWEKGTPKRVNKLSYYSTRKTMPGHVRAALNYNNLCNMHGDAYSMRIADGMKTIVCKLKNNVLKITSIGYPIDLQHIPHWFRKLEFDHEAMEATLIDKKLRNIIGVLGWDLDISKLNSDFLDFFDFG